MPCQSVKKQHWEDLVKESHKNYDDILNIAFV